MLKQHSAYLGPILYIIKGKVDHGPTQSGQECIPI